MKFFKSLLVLAGLIGLLTACNELNDPSVKEKGPSLVLNISTGISTKATTDVLPAEESIKDLQVYIFKKNGNTYELYRYIDTVINAPTVPTTASWEIKGINANEAYSVCVFANGLASNLKYPSFQNRDALRAQAVTLASSVPGSQYTMYGETAADIDVSANTKATVNVTVQRFVSRVRLMTVQNKLPEAYGALTVKRVFVINAYDAWNMYGTGTTLSSPAGITGRFNWAGRNEAGSIITTADDCKNGTVAYGAQTFKAFSKVINNYFAEKAAPGATEAQAVTNSTWVCKNGDQDAYDGVPFYVYPNAHPADLNSNTFRGPIVNTQDAPTRLVVYAEISNNGQVTGYYYPVTISRKENNVDIVMERNKSYDINLLITGFGSDDPNKEPEKGSMELSVNVKPWDEGQTIPQEY